MQDKCTPCLGSNRTLCCKQVTNITTFRSNQTSRIIQIYHNLNCKSKYAIYLPECTKYKIKYVGIAETKFNIRLKNHRKNLWKPDPILASRRFSDKNNSFNTHVIFILIEQIRHIDIDKDKNKERLKQSWILTLETPKSLKALIKNFINIVASIILLTYFHLPNVR